MSSARDTQNLNLLDPLADDAPKSPLPRTASEPSADQSPQPPRDPWDSPPPEAANQPEETQPAVSHSPAPRRRSTPELASSSAPPTPQPEAPTAPVRRRSATASQRETSTSPPSQTSPPGVQTPTPPEETPPAPPQQGPTRAYLPPELWVNEVVAALGVRHQEITTSVGESTDVMVRQLDAGVTRLNTTLDRADKVRKDVDRSTDGLKKTSTALEQQAAASATTLREAMDGQAERLKEHTTAIELNTRETINHLSTARMELAQSLNRLRRNSIYHGMLLGSGIAVIILLTMRLLFPFWGMTRTDVEAWSAGNQLHETYRNAPDAQRAAILRALGWREMPRWTHQPTRSGASPAGGTSSTRPRAASTR